MALLFLVSSLFASSLCQLSFAHNHGNISIENSWQNFEIINGSNVSLACPNVEQNGNVTWWRYDNDDDDATEIAVCRRFDCKVHPNIRNEDYIVQRNASSSSLMITATSNVSFHCKDEDDVVIQTFNVSVLEVPSPKCKISPSLSVEGIFNIIPTLRCEWNAPHGVTGDLEWVGDEVSTVASRIKSKRHIVTVAKLLTRQVSSCKLTFPERNKPLTCLFPLYIDVESYFSADNAVFACDVKHDIENHIFKWRLLDSKNGSIDMASRSWTRDGGRSLLLQEVGEEDGNRMIECTVSSGSSSSIIDAIGFARIKVYDHRNDHDDDEYDVTVERAVMGGILGILLLVIIGLVVTIYCCLYKVKSTLRGMHDMISSLSQENKSPKPSTSSAGAVVSSGSSKVDKAELNYSVPRQIPITDGPVDDRATRESLTYNDGYIYMGGELEDIDYEDMGCVECD